MQSTFSHNKIAVRRWGDGGYKVFDSIEEVRKDTPWVMRAGKFLIRHYTSGTAFGFLLNFLTVIAVLMLYSFLVHIGMYQDSNSQPAKSLWLFLVQIISLGLLIGGIYKSQRRWLSIGYAAVAFVAFVLVYVLMVRIVTSVHPMSLAATNKILDGASWVGLVPCIIAVNIPPRRK